ncbi:sorting nexin-13 isoform X2 [Strongylocentrotus purpuratus]|uniref:Sorting nexin 13 n=1 Tax=Strongylocentrotus purpuratus TaxID=7668 RepID=A0A7M7P9B5_STRPU|nr:sorting nexin-13 isoform X2 [Strongylocentrotus purpuratus]
MILQYRAFIVSLYHLLIKIFLQHVHFVITNITHVHVYACDSTRAYYLIFNYFFLLLFYSQGGKVGIGWLGLGLALFLATFGLSYPVVLISSFLAFAVGALWVVYSGPGASDSVTILDLITSATQLREESIGGRQIVEKMQVEPRSYKIDKRLTGASIIDDQLQEVVLLTLRDYVHPWYHKLSNDEQFTHEIRQVIQNAIISVATKSKDVDWLTYFTRKLVDDVASHVRLFRNSQDKLKAIIRSEETIAPPPDLESVFFDLEIEMENGICRDLVCTSEEKEAEYLRAISEILLFLLIPDHEFHSKPFCFVLREVIANGMIKSMIEQLTDPDYINQTIIWICKDSTFTTEAFLLTIKTAANIDELEAMIEIVDHEIYKQRSRDTNRLMKDEGVDAKTQLKSLQFLRQMCSDTINRILSGEDLDAAEEDDEDQSFDPKTLYSLPLNIVLVNSIALAYFIDFMRKENCQSYVFFWHTVEGYRVMAEQQLSAVQLAKVQPGDGAPHKESVVMEMLRSAALNIFTEYLAEDATNRVKLDSQLVKRTHQRIKNQTSLDTVFDEAQKKVFSILEEDRFLPAFKLSPSYVKCLAELDLLKDDDSARLGDDASVQLDSSPDNSTVASSEDLSSLGSQGSIEQLNDLETPGHIDNNKPHIMAYITHASIVKEKGKSYAVYAIHVTRTDSQGVTEIWDVFRRYSDFHDLHMCLAEKYESLRTLLLPAKRAFKNTNKSFLEKRAKSLTQYIQTLLNQDVLTTNPGLQSIICNFLEPGVYHRGKGLLARRMDHFVNPLKTGVRNVAHTVKVLPGNLADGVTMVSDKMSDTMNKVFKPPKQLQDIGRVSSVISSADDDNIPLRVMLLLVDEVFDLKNRDQWLRRQVETLLRQIIKAAFGTKINSRIIEGVETITSPAHVAELVKRFKESFWPGGVLAEVPEPRDEATKLRTRVAAKAELFGSVPDDLKNFIGSETTRRGMLRTFNMLQNHTLNKRLFYVFLENLLLTLYPENKFGEIFRKLHSQSPRIRARKEKLLEQEGATQHQHQELRRRRDVR